MSYRGLYALIVVSFGGFLYGFHMAVISGVLAFISSFFQLSLYQEGLLVSIMLLGSLFGALVAGFLADRLGRKKTLLLMSAFCLIGALVITGATDLTLLLLGRALSGVGLGIASVVTPLYLAEVAPPHHRGRCVAVFQLNIALGILVAYTLSFLFSEKWRSPFAIGAFFALLEAVFLLFIPESPSWLIAQGKSQKAIAIFRQVRIDRFWKNIKKEKKEKAKWKNFLQPHMGYILFIGLVLSVLQQITGINAIIFYTPKIFNASGVTSHMGLFLSTLSIGGVNFLTTLFSVKVLDKIGRRRLLLVGALGMSVSLALLSYSFFRAGENMHIIALFSLIIYTCCFAFSFGPVVWVLLSEIFPLKIRAHAMAVALALNWLSNFAVALSFPDLLSSLGGGFTLGIYALISFGAFWFVYYFVFETKGKRLEEIESMVNSGDFSI